MADRVGGAPVAQAQRYESLDVLRGFALMGILAMNVMVFAMPMAAYQNPTVYPEFTPVNAWTYRVVHTLFDLKMMALFSMLFGAGVVVWAGKPAEREHRGSLRGLWMRRMWWLLVIGMIHAWWIWEGDILVSYALCGLIVLWWVRNLSPRWLIGLACAFFAIHLLLAMGQGFNSWLFFSGSEAAEAARRGMVESGRMSAEGLAEQIEISRAFSDPTPEQISEQLAAMRGSWMDVFRARAQFTFMMQVFYFPLFIFWRVTAMMLIGAALVKWGVLTGSRSPGFYARMALLCYAIGGPVVVAGIIYNESHGFEVVRFATLGMWFNLVGGVPVTLGHAGLLLWVVKRGWLRPITFGLARAGQMAFTNYLMQSVLCSLIFYGFGLGLAGELNRLQQELVVAVIWVVEILWSVAWLSRYRFGPAEWLWRSLTYWRLQPMLRATQAP